ncbi:MAG TPA: hypothetical protein VMW34_17625 [Anaerolineales bacterium]|nr:hypothetical protein [Anaerolineales bacterium]
MTVIIISIVTAWILFSALLVTIICMNSSRLNRIDEPFKDPAQLARERREKREEYAQSAMQMGAET